MGAGSARVTGLSVATVSVFCVSVVVRLPPKSDLWFIAITMTVMTNMAARMANKRDRLCTLKVLIRAWSEKITRSVIRGVISKCYDSLCYPANE